MESYHEKIHAYRVIPIVTIVVLTLLLNTGLCFLNHVYWDEFICISFISLLFLALLVFELEYERAHNGLYANQSTTFTRVAIGYISCCLLCGVFLYIPAFVRPFMLFPLILHAFSNEIIAFTCSIYFVLIFILTTGGDFYEIVCYCISVVFSVILAKALEEKKMRIWAAILLVFVNEGLSVAFYYLANEEISIKILIYTGISSIILFALAFIIYSILRKDSMKELQNRLLDITSDDFSAVKALYNDFPAEYRHAKKVSDIVYRLAEELGWDAHLGEAAGFYYRIGKWQGEPHVQRGVERATELYFPIEVTQIISEYYGEEKLPSTGLSALVHMVDALSIKMEAMGKDVGLSNWNQEMIIYQTLNEYSSSGIYDSSGMSMNQFLKVREFLVKERWI